MLRPLIVAVRSVPVIAVILLALIWLPVDAVPVFVSLLVSFPLLYQGVFDGLRSVDPDLIDMGRLFHVPVLRRILHIHIPGSLPVVLSALTSAVGMSWKAVIAAEVLSQPLFGIGTGLQVAKLYLETSEVIAWTVIAVVLAAVGDMLVWTVDKRVNAWRSSNSLVVEDSAEGGAQAVLSAGSAPADLTTDLRTTSDSAPVGVRLESVSFAFQRTTVFADLSLEILPGSVTAVLGRSGSGKTTLLRLIAGDLQPLTGSVTVFPEETAGEPPVAFVFQEPRLLPWRSVRENVELVLPVVRPRTRREERRKRLLTFLQSLRLPRAEMFPGALSGGMRHRVNLARGFICGAPVICMDEPFANQDIATRRDLVALMQTLENRLGRTVVLVTHDPDEALELADKIVVLADRQPTSVIANLSLAGRTDAEMRSVRTKIHEALNTR